MLFLCDFVQERVPSPRLAQGSGLAFGGLLAEKTGAAGLRGGFVHMGSPHDPLPTCCFTEAMSAACLRALRHASIRRRMLLSTSAGSLTHTFQLPEHRMSQRRQGGSLHRSVVLRGLSHSCNTWDSASYYAAARNTRLRSLQPTCTCITAAVSVQSLHKDTHLHTFTRGRMLTHCTVCTLLALDLPCRQKRSEAASLSSLTYFSSPLCFLACIPPSRREYGCLHLSRSLRHGPSISAVFSLFC